MILLNIALPNTPDTGIETFFLCLIPIVWLALSDGSTAENRYGPSPIASAEAAG
jgi:uncharacterized membrane protein YhaH (DUF805 family)